MRTLVVCCDGTWNDAADRTHIVRIAEAAKRITSPTVHVFYDEGVGTNFGQILSGGTVGKGLSRNIRQAYGWLVHTWQPDDLIFAFGFSRGAYTVRSLGGFLHFAGLLRQEDTGPLDHEGENQLIETAYEVPSARQKGESSAGISGERGAPPYTASEDPFLRCVRHGGSTWRPRPLDAEDPQPHAPAQRRVPR